MNSLSACLRNSARLFTLLVVAALIIDCKPRPEEVDPLASIYPPGCRIARTVYKTPTIGRARNNVIDPEIITLNDGKTIEVSKVEESTYFYDQKGNIIKIVGLHLNNQVRTRRFKYLNQLLLINEVWTKDGKSIYDKTDSIPLNGRWYQDRATLATNPNRNWVYDNDGYFIARSPDMAKQLPNLYEQGNL